MADITNLEQFLTDVATSIKNKKKTTEPILAANFDKEIDSIVTGEVVEKVVVPAEEIIEETDVVKIVTAPVEQPVVLPEYGKAEVLTPKTTLAENIGLTPDKIISGEQVLGIEGTAESGIDTNDATATAEDILKDKTAYVNNEKIIGTLELSISQEEYDAALNTAIEILGEEVAE